MTYPELLEWIHLLGAATWTGGLITVGAIVPALRGAGVTRDHLRTMARRFGALSWAALLVTVATGVAQVVELDISWTDDTLSVKMGLIVLTVALAGTHQVTARRTTAAVRGILQGLLLGLSIAIFGVAVTL